MKQNSDKKFISYALNLAKKNLGKTAPNPVVGCVIVKNGEIISTGVTAENGRPHAEKIAIEKITDKKTLEGATLYATLEPCSHFGQTPPCIDEIIKNKFKKVVIATQDPDERVNGEGIKKLRQAGIDVVCGILEKEAQEINRGFFKAKKTGLPFVTLKLATSLDGKIATKTFDSKWITSEKARQFSHHLRAINDAILVGANTVRKDDPMLDCRIAGLESFSPKRVIISNNLDFDLNLKIFQTADKIPTIILTNYGQKKILKQVQDDGVFVQDDGALDQDDGAFDQSDGVFVQDDGVLDHSDGVLVQDDGDVKFQHRHPELVSGSFKNNNIKIIFCSEKNYEIDLRDALEKLCASGINSVLIEGGQKTATRFLQENLVDELVWIRNKKIIGNDGISAIGEMNFSKISEVLNSFSRQEIKETDEDLIEIYKH